MTMSLDATTVRPRRVFRWGSYDRRLGDGRHDRTVDRPIILLHSGKPKSRR